MSALDLPNNFCGYDPCCVTLARVSEHWRLALSTVLYLWVLYAFSMDSNAASLSPALRGHAVRLGWTLYSHCDSVFVYACLTAALKVSLVNCIVCMSVCCLDGQQWCIIKSGVKPTWTSSSGCHSGLVCFCPCLSHSSSRRTYICIIIAHAVRLAWTSTITVAVDLSTPVSQQLWIDCIFVLLSLMQWDSCGHFVAIMTADLSTLVSQGAGWTYCHFYCNAVRLVWTVYSHYKSGFVLTCLTMMSLIIAYLMIS